MSSENYTKKSAINSTVGLLTNVVSCLLGFVSRYIFLQILTTEYLGVNGLLSNVLTILSFVELGIGEAMVYAMYKPMKNNDKEKMLMLVNLYKKFYLFIAFIVFLIGIILSFFLDFLIAEKPDIPENIQVLFALFLINNVSSYLMAHKQSILVVDQKKYVVALVSQFVHVGNLVVQSIVLILTKNYYLYLICQIFGTLAINLILTIYVNRNYPWFKQKTSSKLEKEEKNNIFKDIKALSISKIAGVVSNGSDSIVLTKLFGLLPVGFISNYSMVINTVNGFVWGALSSITGSVGQFNVDATLERKRTVFKELYLLTFWVYAFVSICLMVLLDPLVSVWIGKQYIIAKPLAAALILITYVSGLNFPFYTFRVTSGMFEPMKYNYVLFAAVNVGLSIVFGRWLGPVGVFLATTVSRLICSELKEGKIVFKDILQYGFSKYLLLYGGSALILVATYVSAQVVTNLVALDGWIGLFAKTATCVVVVNLVLLLVFFKTKAFKGLVQKGKSFIRR